jgi:phosphatidylglycerol---prolipoprotein diacylglyceryl transferase
VHPIFFHIGPLAFPAFGLLAGLGLMLALLLSQRTAALARVNPAKLWDAGLFAIIAAYVFSRALLLAEHWSSFVRFPVLLLAVPSLTAPGVLLTLIATLLWLWLKQIPIRSALDAWAPCGPLAWAFLALGHWAEGSDPGLTTSTGWQHPVALYAAAFALLLTLSAFWLLRQRMHPGLLAGCVFITAGIGQFFLCFVRVPGVMLGSLETLEWVALGMIAAGAALLLTAIEPDPAIPHTEDGVS